VDFHTFSIKSNFKNLILLDKKYLLSKSFRMTLGRCRALPGVALGWYVMPFQGKEKEMSDFLGMRPIVDIYKI